MFSHARCLFVCAILAIAPYPGWALQVDEFGPKVVADWPRTQTTQGEGTPVVETGISSALGGIRTSTLSLSKKDGPNDFTQADIVTPGGYLRLSDSSGASGTLALKYGDVATHPLNLPYSPGNALTLTFASGNNQSGAALSILVRFLDVDGKLVQTISAADTDFTAGAHNFTLTPTASQISPQVVLPPFSTIDEIDITLGGARDGDYRIHFIALSVPEPASLSALGLLSVALLRKRR